MDYSVSFYYTYRGATIGIKSYIFRSILHKLKLLNIITLNLAEFLFNPCCFFLYSVSVQLFLDNKDADVFIEDESSPETHWPEEPRCVTKAVDKPDYYQYSR